MLLTMQAGYQLHLQVGEAGHEDVDVGLSAVHRHADEVVQGRLDEPQLLVQPQPRVCCHLRGGSYTVEFDLH